jgi:hypothetical protein
MVECRKGGFSVWEGGGRELGGKKGDLAGRGNFSAAPVTVPSDQCRLEPRQEKN